MTVTSEELYERYTDFAQRFAIGMGRGMFVEREEARSLGLLSLVSCVNNCRPDTDIDMFRRYLQIRIKGSLKTSQIKRLRRAEREAPRGLLVGRADHGGKLRDRQYEARQWAEAERVPTVDTCSPQVRHDIDERVLSWTAKTMCDAEARALLADVQLRDRSTCWPTSGERMDMRHHPLTNVRGQAYPPDLASWMTTGKWPEARQRCATDWTCVNPDHLATLPPKVKRTRTDSSELRLRDDIVNRDRSTCWPHEGPGIVEWSNGRKTATIRLTLTRHPMTGRKGSSRLHDLMVWMETGEWPTSRPACPDNPICLNPDHLLGVSYGLKVAA